MKIHALSLVMFALLGVSVQAQQVILGPGGLYPDPFSSQGSVIVNPPNGGLLSLQIGGSVGPTPVGQWDLSATGGLSASLVALGPLLESGSQTSLTTDSLVFSTSSANPAVTTLLLGATLASSWTAKYTFDEPGNIFSINAGQTYTISFDVDGQGGLLDNTAVLNPMFRFSFLDGNNNALTSASNGSLISLVGLFGSNMDGTASFTFTPNASVSGAASLLFEGSAGINAIALNAGDTFATVSNISVTAAPVPEPSGALLIAAVGIAVTMRRFRSRGA